MLVFLSITQHHLGAIGPKFIPQHDSDPKHTGLVIKHHLQRQEEQGVLQQVVWPPRSPDLNTVPVSLGGDGRH